jgi:protein tyrosine phosphatase (PTP) superfamily phosphohydrolase (DUF442 family)
MADLSQIKNFLQVDDYCATAGQPTVEQFADIGAAGYETVIYLGTPDSETALPNEGELVTKQGMRYVHIPVVWTAPKKSDFESIDTLCGEYAGFGIYVSVSHPLSGR